MNGADASADLLGFAVDPITQLSEQYERYVELAVLGRSALPLAAPQYWAPAPAPLTISAH
jgi:hypothetical protein